MSNRTIIYFLRKKAAKDDFSEISENTLLTPIQQDIINLMFKGYDPKDYPDNQDLKRYRKGERLKRYQAAAALSVSEGTIELETRQLIDRIRHAKIFPWMELDKDE